jgi:hypothetical protein
MLPNEVWFAFVETLKFVVYLSFCMDIESKEKWKIANSNCQNDHSADDSFQAVTEIILLQKSDWIRFSNPVGQNLRMFRSGREQFNNLKKFQKCIQFLLLNNAKTIYQSTVVSCT